MRRYLNQNKLLLAITIVLCVIVSSAYIYIAIILQRVTDVAISKDLEAFRNVLFNSVIYLLLLGLISFLYSLCAKRLIRNIVMQMRNTIFSGILRRNVQNFTDVNSADYLSAFTNDIKIIEENYLLPMLLILQNVVMFLTALIVLFTISPIIAMGLIACLLLMLAVPSLLGKSIQGRQEDLSKSLSLFTSKLKDFMSGYEVIKSYNMDNYVKREFDEQNNRSINAKYRVDRLFAVNESLSEVLAYMTLFSSFFIGAYLIIIGNITAGTLLALIQLSSTFVNPIMVLMQCMPQIKSVKPVLKRLNEFADYRDTAFTEAAIPSFKNSITVDGLNFSYDDSHPILTDLSISLEKNKKYALVGPSGCGKSTLIKLLTGSYSNFSGRLLYDNVDIHQLSIDRLRQMISVIHQNVYIFDDSIKQNICLYQTFIKEELDQALADSGVQLFLDNTAIGLDSLAGENGGNLSGGQRQRVAVARALIRKKPILILDEGTSAIDMQTAYDIESSLLQLNDLTVVTITHNMNAALLSLYDRIFYMENGAIREQGRLEELLSKKGAFSRFFFLQEN